MKNCPGSPGPASQRKFAVRGRYPRISGYLGGWNFLDRLAETSIMLICGTVDSPQNGGRKKMAARDHSVFGENPFGRVSVGI